MRTQRTLSQALDNPKLSEAAIAFVNGDTPKLRETTEISGESNTSFDAPLPRGTIRNSTSAHPREPDLPRADVDPDNHSGSVSMTFRLPSDLSARLLRTSLDRNLRRRKPFTQQDIVAEALALWFEKQNL